MLSCLARSTMLQLRRSARLQSILASLEDSDAISLSPNKLKRKNAPGDESVPEKRLRNRNKRTAKPEPVYIIPDVERKETTYRGRLGNLARPCTMQLFDMIRLCLFKYNPTQQETGQRNGILFAHMSVCHYFSDRLIRLKVLQIRKPA